MMMMKKFYLVGMAALLCLGACQQSDDENVYDPTVNGELTSVEFQLDASSLMLGQATRAYTPEYNERGFSIYAYRKAGENYVFEKVVNMTGWGYDSETKTISGSDNLPIGTYKFIHGYGLTQPNVVSITNRNNINTGTLTYNGGRLNEVFLETTKTAETLAEYRLGLDPGQNTTVEGTLNRAVARVDLLLVSADKTGPNEYTEKPYDGTGDNIFGGKVLKNVQLQFTNLTNSMNLFGANPSGTLADSNITLTNPGTANDWNYITIGSGNATTVGTADYTSYDEIEEGHIITGGAHVFGTYLPFNPNADPTTGATIVLTPTQGDVRKITIPGGIPLQRNKVTLIKVNVLKGNNVFTTNVEFEVEIISDWLDEAYNVDGEIS